MRDEPAERAGSAAIAWVDAATLTIAGKGWPDESRTYERLPSRAEGRIPAEPWAQSCAAAGITIRFTSDATQLLARWLDFNGLPAVDQTGPDRPALYVRHRGVWTWLGTAKQIQAGPEHQLHRGRLPAEQREYLICLPISHGLKRFEIGIPAGAGIAAGQPPAGKPLVFYGTSITQGGAASRPGSSHVSIIERHFDRPVVNLGFAGSGRMEPEVIALVSELDAAVFVIDCLPNMVEAEVAERLEPAVHRLRADHPATPLVLVESVPYEDGFLVAERRSRYTGSNRALRAGFARLVAAGVCGLHYIPAEDLFNGTADATVDGTHPNDLGHRLVADCFIRTLAPLLL